MALVAENVLGRRRRIDRDRGNVPQLDLIHRPVLLRPLSAWLCYSLVRKMWQMPENDILRWAREARYHTLSPQVLVYRNVSNQQCQDAEGERRK